MPLPNTPPPPRPEPESSPRPYGRISYHRRRGRRPGHGGGHVAGGGDDDQRAARGGGPRRPIRGGDPHGPHPRPRGTGGARGLASSRFPGRTGVVSPPQSSPPKYFHGCRWARFGQKGGEGRRHPPGHHIQSSHQTTFSEPRHQTTMPRHFIRPPCAAHGRLKIPLTSRGVVKKGPGWDGGGGPPVHRGPPRDPRLPRAPRAPQWVDPGAPVCGRSVRGRTPRPAGCVPFYA